MAFENENHSNQRTVHIMRITLHEKKEIVSREEHFLRFLLSKKYFSVDGF